MVNPDMISDGRSANLYCPECQAHPNYLETTVGRESWRTLRCEYCLTAVNATVAVPPTVPPGEPFDDPLFQTADP